MSEADLPERQLGGNCIVLYFKPMQHSFLVSFLNGETTPEHFAGVIQPEVDACEQGTLSPATVGYVVITDGPQTMLTHEHVRRLLQCLLDERVPWKSIIYTADCLMMSDDFDFEDEKVADAIGFLIDESRTPSSDEIQSVLATLS